MGWGETFFTPDENGEPTHLTIIFHVMDSERLKDIFTEQELMLIRKVPGNGVLPILNTLDIQAILKTLDNQNSLEARSIDQESFFKKLLNLSQDEIKLLRHI